jgi:hypothetical protein
MTQRISILPPILIILVIAITASAQKKPKPNAPVKQSIPVVTDEELLAAYENNEVSADDKYTGKTIRVTGSVNKIGMAVGNQPYVEFGYRDVVAYFPGKSKTLMTLQYGDVLTVEGKCKGKDWMGIVAIEDCKVVSSDH